PGLAAHAEILVAGRGGSVRLHGDWACRAVHHARVSPGRVSRRYSALALLHSAAKAWPKVESNRYLGFWCGNPCRTSRYCDRRLDVFACKLFPKWRTGFEHSVSGMEALAFDFGADFRSAGVYLGS